MGKYLRTRVPDQRSAIKPRAMEEDISNYLCLGPTLAPWEEPGNPDRGEPRVEADNLYTYKEKRCSFYLSKAIIE